MVVSIFSWLPKMFFFWVAQEEQQQQIGDLCGLIVV
jgi:hypothetical protein